MSGKSNCYEFKLVRASGLNDPGDRSKAQNAAVETFIKTIKAELICRAPGKRVGRQKPPSPSISMGSITLGADTQH
jgi:hypothetical protein